jgi:hypothetical protein
MIKPRKKQKSGNTNEEKVKLFLKIAHEVEWKLAPF